MNLNEEIGYVDVLHVLTRSSAALLDKNRPGEAFTYEVAQFSLATRAQRAISTQAFLLLTGMWCEAYSILRTTYECAMSSALLATDRDRLTNEFWRFGRAQRYQELLVLEKHSTDAERSQAIAEQKRELKPDYDACFGRRAIPPPGKNRRARTWCGLTMRDQAEGLPGRWLELHDWLYRTTSSFVHPSPRGMHVMDDDHWKRDCCGAGSSVAAWCLGLQIMPRVGESLGFDVQPLKAAIEESLRAWPKFAAKRAHEYVEKLELRPDCDRS